MIAVNPEHLPFLTICLIMCLLFQSCHARQATETLPRPAAGYLHWLEKESLLGKSSGLVAQVSQSGRLWLNSSRGKREDMLLSAAPNWLLFRVQEGTRQYFKMAESMLSDLEGYGISGIYLSGITDIEDIWISKKGEEVEKVIGNDDTQLAAFIEKAENFNIQTGSTLVGASTARGPDFILQARQAGGHQGLYAMLEVPRPFWARLPESDNEWDATILNMEAINFFAAESLIPEALASDYNKWGSPTGWASTGPVKGMDGQSRRWIYRYEQKPEKPVFLWQDPSGAARQIFSAAIINRTGLMGQTLTGLDLNAFIGLEPADKEKGSLEPALGASSELAAQIHRYGGWAIFIGALPVEGIKKILDGGCDFCLDMHTPLLCALAAGNEDASPIASFYNNLKNEDISYSRLARCITDDGNPDLLLSVAPDIHSNAAGRRIENISQLSEKSRKAIQKLWLGLPGLVFLDMDWNFKESEISGLLKSRQSRGLAEAELIRAETPVPALLVVFSKLSNGDIWLTAINFSRMKQAESLLLPVAASRARDMETDSSISENLEAGGKKLNIELDGLQTMNVVITAK